MTRLYNVKVYSIAVVAAESPDEASQRDASHARCW
jgi:hypothetical protein